MAGELKIASRGSVRCDDCAINQRARNMGNGTTRREMNDSLDEIPQSWWFVAKPA